MSDPKHSNTLDDSRADDASSVADAAARVGAAAPDTTTPAPDVRPARGPQPPRGARRLWEALPAGSRPWYLGVGAAAATWVVLALCALPRIADRPVDLLVTAAVFGLTACVSADQLDL